jgi:hypothetical protein
MRISARELLAELPGLVSEFWRLVSRIDSRILQMNFLHGLYSGGQWEGKGSE